ncbi:hypothetical protein A6A08_21255 [Nocardiopsis sp. TSRI0078]|nr:hypothetical protein A6A08_21255 [Nocardiopsis sp. TSRI0078]
MGQHRVVRLPELGWCVDGDGVRWVRPYLVAHEQRQRAQQRRAGERVPGRKQHAEGASVTGGREAAGEWEELAVLVRQWKAQQVPVA